MAKKKYKVIKRTWEGSKKAKKLLKKEELKGWSLISHSMTYLNQVFVFKKKNE